MSRLTSETSLFQCSGRRIYIFNLFAWIFFTFWRKKPGEGHGPPASPQAEALLWPLNTKWSSKRGAICIGNWSLNIHRVAWGTYFLHGKNGSSKMKMENGSGHFFGRFQKIWAVIWGDAIFLLFLVCYADMDTICSGSFSYHVRFHCLMFVLKVWPGGLCKW